jgi:hypothetical protein
MIREDVMPHVGYVSRNDIPYYVNLSDSAFCLYIPFVYACAFAKSNLLVGILCLLGEFLQGNDRQQ